MPLRRVVRTAMMLALSAALPDALEAQGRASAAATVTLVAHAAPRLTLVELSPSTVISAGDTAHVARQVTTDANVARAIVVRRAGSDPSQPVEVRDRRGIWVPLDATEGIVVFESEALGQLTHVVECRVAAPDARAQECPLAFELTSRNSQFPMRVTAHPAATRTGR